MHIDKNILVAFLLNLIFAILEFIGGFFTNSIAILSDSIHDLGDAISIGLSYILERKSGKKPDNVYTYGYVRYSILGGIISTLILMIGSFVVIYGAIKRLFNPVEINYNGMIIFAIIGIILNFISVYVTRDGKSINQKAVNLHMLEDMLGWIIVLIGAVIMKFSNINYIDSLLSIIVSLFILYESFSNLKDILDIFLEKTPKNIDIKKIEDKLKNIKDVENIHHIHIWSIDGINNYATMHIVTKSKNIKSVKEQIRNVLKEYDIVHSILETEDEECNNTECHIEHHEIHHQH